MYKSMDVSHLLIDEVEHELLIRNILFSSDEHDSVKRRKLKDRMRQEQEIDSFSVTQSPKGREIPDEISIIKTKLSTIESLLNNPKAIGRAKEKIKTRLVHYRVRIFLLSRATDSRKYWSEIMSLTKQATQVYSKHFSDTSLYSGEDDTQPKNIEQDLSEALEEVRNEIETLNETACGIELNDDSGEEVASGGVAKSLETRRQDRESSVRRSEEIMNKLSEYEEGKVENITELIKIFRNFVLQTTEQEKQRRENEILLEEARIRKAGESVERKKRLEKILVNLNKKIKNEPEVSTFKLHQNPTDFPVGESKKIFAENRPLRDNDESESFSSNSEDALKTRFMTKHEKLYRNKNHNHHESKESSFQMKSKQRRRRSTSSGNSIDFSSREFSDSVDSSSGKSVDLKKNRGGKKNKYDRKLRETLKRVPVSDWRLKYDGKDNGRKLAEFLREVKMRSRAEGISEVELFRSAIHLFTGRAKDWYMEGMENRDFRTWFELKSELKREFLPPDLDFQLEIQATNRRQGRSERFVDFFHDIQKLFQSMTRPISDRRKFNIVWRNMRFEYKNAMTGANINSLPKLKRYGRVVDENNWFSFQKPFENTMKSRHNQINEISAPNKANTSSKQMSGHNSHKEKDRTSKLSNQSKWQETAGEKRSPKQTVPLDPMEGSTKSTLKLLVEQYKRPAIGTCYN